MDEAAVYLEAKRRADSLAPPPKFDPFRAGMTGAVVTAGAMVVFHRLAVIDHMTGAIGVIILFGFALPYFHLRSEDRRHWEAFEAEYASQLDLERAREMSVPAVQTSSSPLRRTRQPIRKTRRSAKPARDARPRWSTRWQGPKSI
ncbi:hypothetical protein RFM23_00050 [Mesorhizobium abyssinicae]|uniref:Uncharacterized protein n=1 Tax=Mesorhizobium abyssinicae TaxID=1209958 RepID=A0ABU5AFH0_9HYPH|nr:hypothetical protein [Mesorhizobium abyssinicae]MDX8536009.1 hypothetical protein [Mesorhizobium abyssinicae]